MAMIALTTSQETDPTVRAAAVWALGKIGDAAARDAIVAAKRDTDSFVQDAANIADRLL